MANNACPKCGSKLWWWRDERGCSRCVDETGTPLNKSTQLLTLADNYAAGRCSAADLPAPAYRGSGPLVAELAAHIRRIETQLNDALIVLEGVRTLVAPR